MILLRSSDALLVARVRAIVGEEVVVVHLAEKARVHAGALQATAILVALRGVAPWHESEVPQALGARSSGVPLVAVIPLQPRAVRAALRLQADEVVFVEQLESDLLDVLTRVGSGGPFEQSACSAARARKWLCHILGEDAAFSPFIRFLMIAVLRTETPMRTVRDVLEVVRRPRSTVEYHWHREVVARRGPTLWEFLRWVMLLHAAERWEPQKSLVVRAAELQVDPKTLRAAERQLLGLDVPLIRADTIRVVEQLWARLHGECP